MVAYTMVAHFHGRTRHVHHDVLSRNTRGLELEMVILGMPKELYEVWYRMVRSLLKKKKRKSEVVYTPGFYGRAKREDGVGSSFNHLKEGDGR